MRVFHHHHAHDAHGLDPSSHHHVQHRSARATPWFVIAAVAFLAALTVGCSSDSGSESGGESGSDSGSDSGDTATTAASATTLPENLFDSDFLGACDGVGQPLATAYAPAPGSISPVVVLAGDSASMYARSGAVREAWSRTWTAENPLALQELQLVACAEVAGRTAVQECTGYEVDGVVSDAVVQLNEVTYEVSVHEALTGTELAATTIVARDADCPMFVSFTEGDDVTEHDSFDNEAMMDFLAPFVAP